MFSAGKYICYVLLVYFTTAFVQGDTDQIQHRQTLHDDESEQMSMSNGSTNYTIPEGHVTSESSTKSTGDVDVDERTIVDTCLEENLENKDACEITAGKATDGYQSIDVEIPKKEIGGN